MVDSYETIDFLREQKIKLGNATYIVSSPFLEQGQTLKEKIENLIKLEVGNFSDYKLGQDKQIYYNNISLMLTTMGNFVQKDISGG